MTAEANRTGPVLVTTPTVPHVPDATVVASGAAWSTVFPSVHEAIAGLQRWAADNRWDAIVGLRVEAATQIVGAMAGGWGQIKSTTGFVAYGTAIRYGDV